MQNWVYNNNAAKHSSLLGRQYTPTDTEYRQYTPTDTEYRQYTPTDTEYRQYTPTDTEYRPRRVESCGSVFMFRIYFYAKSYNYISNLKILAYRIVCIWPTDNAITTHSGIGSKDLSSTKFILNPSSNFEEHVRLWRSINTPSPSHACFAVAVQIRMKICHLTPPSRNSDEGQLPYKYFWLKCAVSSYCAWYWAVSEQYWMQVSYNHGDKTVIYYWKAFS